MFFWSEKIFEGFNPYEIIKNMSERSLRVLHPRMRRLWVPIGNDYTVFGGSILESNKIGIPMSQVAI